MPISFWFFLLVCIVSFVPVIKDHGESWKEYKASDGKAKKLAALQVFALWAAPLFTAIGTVISGFEAVTSGRENAALIAQAGEANRLASEADHRSLKMALQVEELKKANLELYAKLQPRELTVEQKNKIVAALKGAKKGSVNVVVRLEDLESNVYCDEVVDALIKSGFRGMTIERVTGTIQAPVGVQFWYKNQDPPIHGVDIINAFNQAGVANLSTNVYGNMDENLFQIFVGYKPIRR